MRRRKTSVDKVWVMMFNMRHMIRVGHQNILMMTYFFYSPQRTQRTTYNVQRTTYIIIKK
jgi:hypothetical protein